MLAVALCCACSAPQTDWYAAEPDHKPGLRWWWLGSAVDEAGLTYNMEEFAAKGIGAVEITPIYGVQGNEANDIDYLSPRWMEVYRHTVAEGERLGIEVDMSNCTGWPFGGPQIGYAESAAKYVVGGYLLSEGEHFETIVTPPASEKHPEVARLQRIVAYRGDRHLDLTDRITDDSLFVWDVPPTPAGEEPCPWTVYTLFSSRTLQKVKRAAPGGEGLVMNHYDRKALERYLERFDRAFAESGAPWPAVFFNDSYEVYGASWTDDFLAEFERLNGYRLEDHLREFAAGQARFDTKADMLPYQPLSDAERDLAARVVTDYRETLAGLLYDNFTLPWTAWAHSHGVRTRNQAHGSPGNILDYYAAVDIPECESFGRTPFDIPGLRQDSIIKLNDSDPSVLKFASSAAHVAGKRITSSETLTWMTEHFRTSLSQCKPELDQMFCAGVNRVFFHGAPYSPPETPFPGWMFYAAINMSPTNTIWRDAGAMMGYITRCQSFLQAGDPDNDFLVYMPLYDIWHRQQSQPYLLFDIHKMDRTLPEFKRAVEQILEAGYDTDYISDRYIASLRVNSRGELVSEGGATYRALLLPSCSLMPEWTLQRLVDLASSGATIVFLDSYPHDVPGLARLEERRASFAAEAALLPAADFTVTQTQRLGRGRIITGPDCRTALAATGAAPEPFRSELGGSMIRRRNEAGGHNYFLAMLRNRPIDGWVPLGTAAASVEIFDPLTGCRGMAESRTGAQGLTEVRLALAPGQSLLLKTFPDRIEGVQAWEYHAPAGDPIVLDRGWTFAFTDTEPSTPESFETDTLCPWTALDTPCATVAAGSGTYTCTFTLDDPALADDWLLDLGDVRESARASLNGEEIGTLWSVPFTARVGHLLRPGENRLTVTVTNMPSNRIADYERRGVRWRIFKDANVASVTNARQFDFGTWPVDPAGLNSRVTLTPLKNTNR